MTQHQKGEVCSSSFHHHDQNCVLHWVSVRLTYSAVTLQLPCSATGYIGGATLAHLLSSPATASFTYSALVRNKEKASLLKSFGVHPIIGTLDDAAILSAEAQKADVVIHTADSSDHVASCEAILEGMQKISDNPILIHIVRDDSICLYFQRLK